MTAQPEKGEAEGPMKKLKSTFEEVFGLPFSVLPLPDYELEPWSGQVKWLTGLEKLSKMGPIWGQ